MLTTNATVMPENRTGAPGTFAVGEAVEDWTGDARFFEYGQAADRVDPATRQIVDPIRFTTDDSPLGPRG